jgi:hypothetical protein
MGGSVVKKIYWVLALLLLVSTATYLLVGCGGGSHTPGYVGEWSRGGMGTMIYNLRADGAYSLIGYAGVPHASAIMFGEMGTYVVASGSINFTISHTYNSGTTSWDVNPSVYPSIGFSYIRGVSITITELGSTTYDYYGPPTSLPTP